MGQGSCRRGKAQMMIFFPSYLFRHLIEPGEKRGDEIVELLACLSQGKRAAMEKFDFKELFKLEDLAAHGWLLDAVRHLSDGFGDAFKFGNVVEKLEMMDVHTERETSV
jgi:hypothetical protein